jgi:large subunit ribosomal protein L3
MKILLGTKEKMTQVFGEDGKVYPVTVLNAGPAVVTQIKTKEKDGYEGVQIGFGEKKAKNLSKALKGHMKDANFRYLREFKVSPTEEIKIGSKIEASSFEKGDKVEISSFSKGKGFQGVVKRHGFHGGPRSHGQKHSEREPGSIGAGGIQRVQKGMRMAGRMGNDKVTLKGVEIVDIDSENNQILVKGGVPGRKGTLVEITGKESPKKDK